MTDPLDTALDKAVSLLHEHCDSVRIFCTLDDPEADGDTRSYTIGRGNFFAQLGQVVTWLNRNSDPEQPFEDGED
jgi:hypothetical protein